MTSAEYSKKWRADNRERHRAYNKAWREAHPEWRRRYERKKKYGIKNPTGEAKTGTCPICEKSGQPLVYDHNHATGEFRGWLCGPCNRRLGIVEAWYLPNKGKVDQYLSEKK